MSAFDIAGAVVWTPSAVLLWSATFTLNKKGDVEAVRIGLPLAIGAALGAIFCIARLNGAHL